MTGEKGDRGNVKEVIEWKPVIWYVKALKIKWGKRKSIRLNLGYCSFGKGISFISRNMIHVFVIRSVEIHRSGDKIWCGDEKWCFNLKCPLNKAEVDKFRSYGISSREELEKCHRLLERCVEKLRKMYGDRIFEERDGFVYFEGGSPLELFFKD
ncbi:MAG: hypothetical protein QXQ93_09235 [Ignisphaera sp.]